MFHHRWQPASSRVRLGPPQRLIFLSPWEIKRTSGSRIEPVLDDEYCNIAVSQRSVVTSAASCSIAVHAIIRSKSLFFRPLRSSWARSAASRRTTARPSGSIGEVLAICLMRAHFAPCEAIAPDAHGVRRVALWGLDRLVEG